MTDARQDKIGADRRNTGDDRSKRAANKAADARSFSSLAAEFGIRIVGVIFFTRVVRHDHIDLVIRISTVAQ